VKFLEKPALQVEIGNYLLGTGNDRAVKNKWLWEGLNKLGIDVLNVADDDISGLMDLGVDLQKDGRLISANLVSSKTGQPLLNPYLVKTVPLKETEKRFRVGFLGLSSRDSFLTTDSRGYVWADPLVSVTKWLPELKGKCDFLIVLACMPSKDAVELAINNPTINIILNGYKHQFSSPLATINKSTLVYAEDEGRILGELRFLVEPGKQVDVNPINHFLTSTVNDDPEMAAFVAQARGEIAAAQNQLAKAVASPPMLPKSNSPSNYVSASNCATCHQLQFDAWSRSNHAHAIEILKRERREFDTACVGCHVTGFRMPGGFVDLLETPQLVNVQCEVCHGPGREHGVRPTAIKMLKAGPQTCQGCHTKSTSPEFEFAVYWERIKH
jgi:mono/diheme cytochrome c family protein